MLRFNTLRLIERAPIAADAVTLRFEVPEALREDYRFVAGQHLVVRANLGGRTLRRTYSIVSPEGGPLAIGVRVQGEVSRHLAESLVIGDVVDVMTPNGTFSPTQRMRAPEEPPAGVRCYAAFAAGSGITPILSIVSTLLANEPHSRVWLYYGNRDAARAMFVPELLALKNRYLDRFAPYFIMSGEPQEVELLNGRLDAAKLRALVARRALPLDAIDEFFVCGPGPMIDELSTTLVQLGASGKVHFERFAAARPAASGTPRAPAPHETAASAPAGAGHGDGAQILVRMDGRQREFRMPRDGRSILEAAEAAGLELPFSCRDGICSTCRVRVVAGEVEMRRNQALEPWEVAAGFVLCCQARPKSRNVELTYDEK